MSDKPVTPEFSEAEMPSLRIQTIADLQSALRYLGVTAGSTPAPSATTYAGDVTSNAAGTIFPAGWSVGHTGTGIYTITHNLASTNYIVMLTMRGAYFSIHYQSKNTNTFQVVTNLTTSTPADLDFSFFVIITS